jgi:2-polyprenyl-3-methyl-5-hydroxy-6-metoxy-1,4-benzoquinol methylase
MTPTSNHASEISRGQRFEFGANWTQFLNVLNEEGIAQAEKSLKDMLGVRDLASKRFLDVGSGSGLFSLAARRLGATVHSFDYDPESVGCTQELKRRHFPDDCGWTVEQASVLDREYLAGLGHFDVVYSWGVLHHTGAMWLALENVASLVAEGGQLFISIYNDQGWISSYWRTVKKVYARSAILRWPLLLLHGSYLFGLRWVARAVTGRLKLQRGMSLWHDTVDWIGGYPFEVARPEAIFRFFRELGFVLHELKTCGGRHGCNEFVLVRDG